MVMDGRQVEAKSIVYKVEAQFGDNVFGFSISNSYPELKLALERGGYTNICYLDDEMDFCEITGQATLDYYIQVHVG